MPKISKILLEIPLTLLDPFFSIFILSLSIILILLCIPVEYYFSFKHKFFTNSDEKYKGVSERIKEAIVQKNNNNSIIKEFERRWDSMTEEQKEILKKAFKEKIK